ncbi:unnamed protein product [Chrysodeixis includens]|uniref:Uncharacterized protein n=1 Tax=Chrysodeixis includens TaxID=689277 RepID=A0A9N8PZR8_CHRIL|nr:unnamed protein product [Chrysodeixis includens]
MGRCEEFMEAGYGEVVVGCEVRRDDAPMDAGLDSMHPLDPPPPDVLLALLARNKALEARVLVKDATRQGGLVSMNTVHTP